MELTDEETPPFEDRLTLDLEDCEIVRVGGLALVLEFEEESGALVDWQMEDWSTADEKSGAWPNRFGCTIVATDDGEGSEGTESDPRETLIRLVRYLMRPKR